MIHAMYQIHQLISSRYRENNTRNDALKFETDTNWTNLEKLF